MSLKFAAVALGIIVLVGVGVGVVAYSNSTAQAPLDTLMREALEEDIAELRSLARDEPNKSVSAQVVLRSSSRVDEIAPHFATRDIRVTAATGVLPAGGQEHVSHFGLPLGASHEDFPRLYAERNAAFVESLIGEWSGKLEACDSSIDARRLSGPNGAEDQYSCPPEVARAAMEASLVSLREQLDQVRSFGYPVIALEIEGRSADVAGLIDDPQVRTIGLADADGRMPNPFALRDHPLEEASSNE